MFFKPSEDKILADVRHFMDESYPDCADVVDFSVHKRVVSIVLIAKNGLTKDKASELHDALHDLIVSSAGVRQANVVLTAEKERSSPAEHTAIHLPKNNRKVTQDGPLAPHVRHIIAVASGKGGVGKSTIANNLAIALQQSGLLVGILDADVYGPSQAHMMGVTNKKPETIERNGQTMLVPVESHGIKIMSMAFMVEQDKALIWRGPMVQSAVTQMLRDVDWGELDVLIVDMPPGTGDAALTLAQKVPLSGAVVVSTPQDIALLDAVRGVEMFRKVNVPILGLIENMSIFCCPNCGHQVDFFNQGGVQKKAITLNVPFLGALPLEASVCEASEAGKPVILYHPKSDHADTFRDMAANLWANLEKSG